MEEESKAIQEVAKTISKAIDLSEKFGKFLSSIFGEGFENIGGTFSDWTNYFRYKNMLKLQDKVLSIHRQRHIEGKTIPIPPRYALPLLDSATLEDDDNIQDKWAGLIANSTDPNKNFQFQKIFIQILTSIEPLDAAILDLLHSSEKNENQKRNSEDIAKTLDQDKHYVIISVSNLFRLGCIIDNWVNVYDSEIPKNYQGFRVNSPISDFRLSQLGKSLMEACKIS
jgi:hypothetical protein